MVNPLSSSQLRDSIIKNRYKHTEDTAFFLGNFTKAIENSGKAALTTECGQKAIYSASKMTKNFSKGDKVCRTLCSISLGFEVACVVVTWVPIPCKLTCIGILKGISRGLTKFRDMCAQNSLSPLC